MTRAYRKSPAPEAVRRAEATEMAALNAGGISIEQAGMRYGLTREGAIKRLVKYGFCIQAPAVVKDFPRRVAAKQKAADDLSCRKWGCDRAAYLRLRKMQKPTHAFAAQRRNANDRGIAWEFNLWQWWSVWERSGKWSERGCGYDRYVMCRKGDVGPYATDNVYIALGTHNTSVRPQKKSGLPTGVAKQNGGRFVAKRMIDGRKHRIGSFNTAEEAGIAYEAFAAVGRTGNVQPDARA